MERNVEIFFNESGKVLGYGGDVQATLWIQRQEAELREHKEMVNRLQRALGEALKLIKPQDCAGWDENWCPTSCTCWKVCGLGNRWEGAE